ncbi:MAG TPA: G1 family glutamic endopeptidase [Chloroflexota bacterium]
MDILPNNFADWPAGKPLRGSEPIARGMRGRVAFTVILLITLGGLLGFGAYRWVIGPDQAALSPTPSLTAPAQDDPASTTPADAASSPADDTEPALDVTGLLGNQAQSQNWAGYAAAQGSYTSVSATWTIPDVPLSSPAGMDAAWVGIGGLRSRDLIQAGTLRTVLGNGATQQEAWVELLPRASETVPLTVGPGDTVRVSIDQQGPELWLVAFADITTGQTYSVTERYASSLTSVEWIEEAPSTGRRTRTLPLDNFGTIHFSQASAVRDGQVLNMSQSGAHAITMITPGGLPLATPSGLGADGESFSVTRTSTPSPSRRP